MQCWKQHCSPLGYFCFAGTFDMGMYGYALISTQNAARAAAVFTSTSTAKATDSAKACQFALAEMDALPNVEDVSSCIHSR